MNLPGQTVVGRAIGCNVTFLRAAFAVGWVCIAFFMYGEKRREMKWITFEQEIKSFPPPHLPNLNVLSSHSLPQQFWYHSFWKVTSGLWQTNCRCPPRKRWGSWFPPLCPSSGHWHLESSGLKFLRLPENRSPVLVYPLPFHCSDFSFFCSFHLLSFSLNTLEPLYQKNIGEQRMSWVLQEYMRVALMQGWTSAKLPVFPKPRIRSSGAYFK